MAKQDGRGRAALGEILCRWVGLDPNDLCAMSLSLNRDGTTTITATRFLGDDASPEELEAAEMRFVAEEA